MAGASNVAAARAKSACAGWPEPDAVGAAVWPPSDIEKPCPRSGSARRARYHPRPCRDPSSRRPLRVRVREPRLARWPARRRVAVDAPVVRPRSGRARRAARHGDLRLHRVELCQRTRDPQGKSRRRARVQLCADRGCPARLCPLERLARARRARRRPRSGWRGRGCRAQHLRRHQSRPAHAQSAARVLRRRCDARPDRHDGGLEPRPTLAARLCNRRHGAAGPGGGLCRHDPAVAADERRPVESRQAGRDHPSHARASGNQNRGHRLRRVRRRRSVDRGLDLHAPHSRPRHARSASGRPGEHFLGRADGRQSARGHCWRSSCRSTACFRSRLLVSPPARC